MPDGLIVLQDAPTNVADGEHPRSRIQVARFGRFRHPVHGRFPITREMAEAWKRNLSERFGGQVSIDLDHSSDRGRGTEAAGWIKGLDIDGDAVYADVEWTKLGATALRERRYAYVSPTFVGNYRDEEGRGHGDALIGAGLTNRPHLRSMPALSLSQAPLLAELDEDAEAYWLADFSQSERDELAKKGQARKDGSFPIRNESDLRNAIRAVGRAKDPDAAKAHIRKRAKAMGKTDLLPDSWQLDAGDAFDELLATALDAKSVGPVARAQLSKLLKHYAGKAHPFTTCVRDNTKRFGPDGAKRVCATLKDIIRGTTHWREGSKSLSADERVELDAALDALSESDLGGLMLTLSEIEDGSDTHASMPDLTQIAKALGLDESADEAKVLERAEELAQRPEPSEGTKTLDEQAQAAGKVLMDSTQKAELERKANEGADAAQQLRESRFEQSFQKALDEVRVDAKDETKERYRKLYDAVPDETIATLDSLPKLASTEPRGSGGGPATAPDGVDSERFQLDQAVDKRMREKGEDYSTALDAVLEEQVSA